VANSGRFQQLRAEVFAQLALRRIYAEDFVATAKNSHRHIRVRVGLLRNGACDQAARLAFMAVLAGLEHLGLRLCVPLPADRPT
jgi:hypothetical protein